MPAPSMEEAPPGVAAAFDQLNPGTWDEFRAFAEEEGCSPLDLAKMDTSNVRGALDEFFEQQGNPGSILKRGKAKSELEGWLATIVAPDSGAAGGAAAAEPTVWAEQPRIRPLRGAGPPQARAVGAAGSVLPLSVLPPTPTRVAPPPVGQVSVSAGYGGIPPPAHAKGGKGGKDESWHAYGGTPLAAPHGGGFAGAPVIKGGGGGGGGGFDMTGGLAGEAVRPWGTPVTPRAIEIATDDQKPELISVIKEGQRSDEQWKAKWEMWTRHNGGRKDPAMYSAPQLFLALERCGQPQPGAGQGPQPGDLMGAAAPGGSWDASGGGWGGGGWGEDPMYDHGAKRIRIGGPSVVNPAPAGQRPLVEIIKQGQRGDPEWRERWQTWCRFNGGRHDPSVYTDQQLELALERCGQPGEPAPTCQPIITGGSYSGGVSIV